MNVIEPAPPAPACISGVAAICLDCADPIALGRFYAALLGAPLEIEDDGSGAGLSGLDGPNIDFLPVPEGKSVKNRLHLDFRAVDIGAAVALALALGATLAPDVYDGDAWVVLRDIEGNEFCFLRPREDGAVRHTP